MSSRTKIEGERGTVTEFRLTGRHTPAAGHTAPQTYRVLTIHSLLHIQGLHYHEIRVMTHLLPGTPLHKHTGSTVCYTYRVYTITRTR